MMGFIKYLRLCLLLAITAIVFPTLMPAAQGPHIIISLLLESHTKKDIALTESRLIQDFEAIHPDIKINLVFAEGFYENLAFSPSPEDYFSKLRVFAARADVLYVRHTALTPESTRTGAFLDLAPLVAADPDFHADDFYPAAYQSFQWDNSLWALPSAITRLWVLNYDPAAFDKAGLAYPNDHWTLADITQATKALAETDGTGKVTAFGLDVDDGSFLLRSLLQDGLLDKTRVPNLPVLDRPDVVQLINGWLELKTSGLVGPKYGGSGAIQFKAPLSLWEPYQSGEYFRSLTPVLLPGGTAGIWPDGFAVSSGTQYPDQAYALAKYLTTRVEPIQFNFGRNAARRGLNHSDVPFRIGPNPTEAQWLFIEQALEHAMPYSEIMFFNYLQGTLSNPQPGKIIDGAQFTQDLQKKISDNIALAETARQSFALVVATPVPTVKPGELSLRFGVGSTVSPLPTADLWNRVVEDFMTRDPEVRQIILDTSSDIYMQSLPYDYDCFFVPNAGLLGVDTAQLVDLAPLMAADKNFDAQDLLPGVDNSLESGTHRYAYPLTLSLLVLRYDNEKFSQAGLTTPKDWTINEFVDALKTLKANPSDPVPFVKVSQSVIGAHLLMLIAAYGGLPIDYRTSPPTIGYSDPVNVAAIRQVLDLARSGYIDYKALGTSDASGRGGEDAAIYVQSIFTFQAYNNFPARYQITGFPHGNLYVPVAYNVGGAYISAQSRNTSACYRWISTLARHPELFLGMPTTRAMLNSQELVSAQGETMATFFQAFAKQLSAPNAVYFPTVHSTPYIGFVLERWLYRAFDRYVLQNGDLEAELSQADQYAKAFIACVSETPPSNGGVEAIYEPIGKCIEQVDPSINAH